MAAASARRRPSQSPSPRSPGVVDAGRGPRGVDHGSRRRAAPGPGRCPTPAPSRSSAAPSPVAGTCPPSTPCPWPRVNHGDGRHAAPDDVQRVVRTRSFPCQPHERVELGGGAPDRRGGAMQALQLTEWQHEPELREVDPPEPGPGEVLVRVVAAGACHSDLHLMHDFAAGVAAVRPALHARARERRRGRGARRRRHAASRSASRSPSTGRGAAGGAWPACRAPRTTASARRRSAPSGGGLGRDGGMAPLMIVPAARYLVPLGGPRPRRGRAAHRRRPHAVPRHPPRAPGAAGRIVGRRDRRRRGTRPPGGADPAGGVAGPGHRGRRSARRPRAGDRLGAHATVAAGDDAAARIRELTGGRNADAVFDFVGVDATMALGAVGGPAAWSPHDRRHRRRIVVRRLLHDPVRGHAVHDLLGHHPRAARADRPRRPGRHLPGGPALHGLDRRHRRLPGDAATARSRGGP